MTHVLVRTFILRVRTFIVSVRNFILRVRDFILREHQSAHLTYAYSTVTDLARFLG